MIGLDVINKIQAIFARRVIHNKINSVYSLLKTKSLLLRASAVAMLAVAAVLALASLASAVEVKVAPESETSYGYAKNEEGDFVVKVSAREAADESIEALEVNFLDQTFDLVAHADAALGEHGGYADFFSANFDRTCDVNTWTMTIGNTILIAGLDDLEMRFAIKGTGDDAYTLGGDAEYLWGNNSGTFPEHAGQFFSYVENIDYYPAPEVPEGHLLIPEYEESAKGNDEKAPGVPNTSRSTSSGSATLIAIGASLAVLVAGVVTYRRYSRQ